MIRLAFLLIGLLVHFVSYAQQADSSIKSLEQIEVKGLDIKTELSKTPASISVIRQNELNRFSNTSLVPMLNTVPGVRMEERSPGSYRLSIRGSLLRSPFGVRNIKVYWKDMPLTDAGGNTYINLLDVNSVGRVEIIKGPAGSIYGAGTGGVIGFSNLALGDSLNNGGFIQFSGGSYNAKNGSGAWQWNGKNGSTQVFQSFQSADGYRRNSAMQRSVTQLSGNWSFHPGQQLEYLVLYTDLRYRTPGGLTLAQSIADPRQARPATAILPSAEQQQAGIFNKTVLAGLTNTLQLSSRWKHVTSLVFTRTKFDNPFITNYERRSELNFALRSKWVCDRKFYKHHIQYMVGLESVSGVHQIDSTGNQGGQPMGIKASDRVRANHSFLFTEGQIRFKGGIILNAGISLNSYGYDLKRKEPVVYRINPDFNPAVLPRISALFPLRTNISAHISASKGYSSPTLSEIRPSAGGFYGDLQAEKGWNLETGVRGSLWKSKIRFDVSAFRFLMKEAIIRQVDNRGAEYFVNAGRVAQNGLEIFLEAMVHQRSNGLVRYLRITNSSSFSKFRFVQYVMGSNDYSGNALTGVPSKVLNNGLDMGFAGGLYMNANFTYTSALPLSDANDVYADDYRLLQTRIGWKQQWGKKKTATDIFISGDNLLNQRYSLGNDINAFGRRYYNPAPLTNWTAGVRVVF